MSGAYAHLTVINRLTVRPALKEIEGIDNNTINLILDNSQYCELGSLSPDYPYLLLGNTQAQKWGDLMHFNNTADFIRVAIKLIIESDSENKEIDVAWLLGFSAHVGTDLTIHPIVENKVGLYVGNEREHRVCEMNQDAFIYHDLNLGGIGYSEHLDSIVSLTGDDCMLEPSLVRFWEKILRLNYPDWFNLAPPEINAWHKWFYNSVDKIAESGQFIPVLNIFTPWLGVSYPSFKNIEYDYINKLKSPKGDIHYKELFQCALKNVQTFWSKILLAINKKDPSIWDYSNFNLGTGEYTDKPKEFVFWS